MLELGPSAGESAETNTSIGGPSSQATAGAVLDNRTQRMRLVRKLTNVVREQRLQQHGVELLWVKTKDLYETQDREQRHDMLSFFEALVRGQVRLFGVNSLHPYPAFEQLML